MPKRDYRALLCGVPSCAIEFPIRLKRYLGLDAEQSWVVQIVAVHRTARQGRGPSRPPRGAPPSKQPRRVLLCSEIFREIGSSRRVVTASRAAARTCYRGRRGSDIGNRSVTASLNFCRQLVRFWRCLATTAITTHSRFREHSPETLSMAKAVRSSTILAISLELLPINIGLNRSWVCTDGSKL